MRIYLPATTADLIALRDEGSLAGPRAATALTPDLREFYASGGDEELEYAALSEAARLSLRMIDNDPGAARRRVVIVAEVPDSAVTADESNGRGVVRLADALTLGDVASLQVDDAEAEDAVRAAADVVLEADLGSADAQFVVDGAEGFELGWYGTQELGILLELL